MSEKNYLEQIYESMVILEGDHDLVALNERQLSPFLLEVSEAEIEDEADKLQLKVKEAREQLGTVISLLPDIMTYTKAFFIKLRDETLPTPGALAKMMLRGNLKKVSAEIVAWNAHLANIHASDSLLRKGGEIIKRRLSPVPGYQDANDAKSLKDIIGEKPGEGIPDLDLKSLKVAMDRHWKPPPGDAKFLNKIMQVGGRLISMIGGEGLIGTLNKNRVFDEFVDLKKGQFENLVDGLPVAELEDMTPSPAEETALVATAEDLADDPEVTSPDAATPGAPSPGASPTAADMKVGDQYEYTTGKGEDIAVTVTDTLEGNAEVVQVQRVVDGNPKGPPFATSPSKLRALEAEESAGTEAITAAEFGELVAANREVFADIAKAGKEGKTARRKVVRDLLKGKRFAESLMRDLEARGLSLLVEEVRITHLDHEREVTDFRRWRHLAGME
jgi:hypothetical protein